MRQRTKEMTINKIFDSFWINQYFILIMKRGIAVITATAALAFISGRYLQQQQTKKIEQDVQSLIANRNSHAASTVLPPFRRIAYPHFQILYSTYHRSPLSVHEILTKSLIEGDAPRAKFFFPDENIKEKHLQVDQSFFAETEAFRRFSVNRGHMAAAGNYSSNESEKFHTFSFANVIPQNGYNNGGIWNTFERYARRLTLGPLCESVEVISGPIYLKETPGGETESSKVHQEKLVVLKENGIPIPQRLYKIIKCNSHEGKPYFSAFQFANSQTYDNSNVLIDFKTTLKEVQRQTGLQFGLKGSQLQQIDRPGLMATKHDLDKEFYFGLMSNSGSIGEMQDNYRRAREQKIQIDFSLLTDQIRTMAGKQIGQIEKEEDCGRLKHLVMLKKKLYQLYHLEQTKDLWEGRAEAAYKECAKKQNKSEEECKILDSFGEQQKSVE